jgi:hypothetical protein
MAPIIAPMVNIEPKIENYIKTQRVSYDNVVNEKK